MKEYAITWKIELDADSPEEAVTKAMAIHRDPNSVATVFEVAEDGKYIGTFDAMDISGEEVTHWEWPYGPLHARIIKDVLYVPDDTNNTRSFTREEAREYVDNTDPDEADKNLTPGSLDFIREHAYPGSVNWDTPPDWKAITEE